MASHEDYKNRKIGNSQDEMKDQLARAVRMYADDLHKCAENGDPEKQFQLAKGYLSGFPVPEDPEKAVYWLKRSAEQGYTDAMMHLSQCFSSGTGTGKDLKQALYWVEKAAAAGNAEAQVLTGTYYHLGNGVAADRTAAERWFRKAADQGSPDGQFFLGMCHIENGTRADLSSAVQLFRKAADQGHRDAMQMYGRCYEMGIGPLPKDLSKAVEWYQKAVDAGCEGAKEDLEKARREQREETETAKRAKELRQREQAEALERARVQKLKEARDISLDIAVIIGSVLFAAAYLVNSHGSFSGLTPGRIAVCAVAVIGGALAFGVLFFDISESLVFPGLFAGALAAAAALFLHLNPTVNLCALCAAGALVLISVIRIIVKRSRPKP